MCIKECKYRDNEMPICNTLKELRNCNTSVCCFYCPTADFCSHVCGVKNFKFENNIFAKRSLS